MISLTEDEVLRLRLRGQQLTGERAGSVSDVVGRVGALQAQSTRAARLAVRPRSEGLDATAVDRACNEARSVVRTWAMRGTLHMLATPDVGWVVELYRPPPAIPTRRQRELGLDTDLLTRALPAIREVLSGSGGLTRAALVSGLAGEGVVVDPRSQAPAHLVAYAARQGLICRGPDLTDDEPTYVLLDEWVGELPPVESDEALAALARRYVAAHGPVAPRDLASWSGLPAAVARRAFTLLADELREVDAAGERAWLPVTADPAAGDDAPCVRLLPHFDAYLLGYRDREAILPSRFTRRVQAGGGFIRPTVVVDGRVAGTWSTRRTSRGTVVSVQPFERLDARVWPLLEAEAHDVGRFLATSVTLEIDAA